jgi:hypothetical protein
MNALVERRTRIVKVRGIEKRIAELALAQAHRDLSHVEAVVERLAALNANLPIGDNMLTGAALAAHSEMKMRLAHASNAMSKPLAAAKGRHRESFAAHVQVVQKCEGANRLLQKARDVTSQSAERYADANRIFRRHSATEGLAS